MIYYYPIDPVPKPRMTRSDNWKQRPSVMRYRAFKDKCRDLNVQLREYGCSIIFHVAMPKSWSKKKRAEHIGQANRQTPDLDNYLKALSDAIFFDDSAIWHYNGLCKLWAETGSITIQIDETKEVEVCSQLIKTQV